MQDEIYLSINGTCLDITLSELLDIELSIDCYCDHLRNRERLERSEKMKELLNKIESFSDRHLLPSK